MVSVYIIPFLKDGAALQVFVKCKLIRHKLEVYATNKETFSIRNGITQIATYKFLDMQMPFLSKESS